MFGLFSNKKDKKEETQKLHPEFLKLVEKWDGFLYKIETRFNESLLNAEDAILENLDDSDYDLTPTMRAWQGIKSQLMGLTEKIDETYDEKVAPQMLEYIEQWDAIEQGQKGTILRESIFERIERFEITIEGKVSQKFYNHAIKLLNEDFNCTQCSAKLEIRKDIFRSHYVDCQYCNTVNTFTPNDKIAQIKWVADNIAKYNVIDKWDAMKKAQKEFQEIRNPHEDEDKTIYTAGFKKREETERVFWTAYFTERSNFLPDYKETIEHDTDVKMKWFYEERKRMLNF